MVRAVRRSGLVLALPALVGLSTLLQWLAGRRLTGLWIMPDEAIYAERALNLWRHGHLAVVHGEGAGYGFLYPCSREFPCPSGRLATGYASLKLLQASAMSMVAAPVFFYGRRFMRPGYALLAAALALASPLCLYSGLVMTEVLMYPLGALALLVDRKGDREHSAPRSGDRARPHRRGDADASSVGRPGRHLRRGNPARLARAPRIDEGCAPSGPSGGCSRRRQW